MTKVVLDANVIISSIFWRGKPYQLMRKGIEGKCAFVISAPIIDEVISKLRGKFNLPDDKIETLVDILLAFSTLVEPKVRLNVVRADASDNKIIECAVEEKRSTSYPEMPTCLKCESTRGLKS